MRQPAWTGELGHGMLPSSHVTWPPGRCFSMMTGWTMSLDGWLWMAVWIAVLVVAVWLLTRTSGRAVQDDPLTLLRARLARGEITPEEFERSRVLLESSPGSRAR